MPQKTSAIKCRKCGYEPNVIGDICIKCGAKLDKICGECGFVNAVEKNYCDLCGMVMALEAPPRKDGASAPPLPIPGSRLPAQPDAKSLLPPPPAAGAAKPPEQPKYAIEIQPILDTVSEQDISFKKHFRSGPSASPTVAVPKPFPSPPFAKAEKLGASNASPKMAAVKKMAGIVLTAGLSGAFFFVLYLIAMPHIPRIRLEMTARSYLKKLSTARYEEAYALLSSNSKAAVSMAEYVAYSRQYYGQAPPWEVRDVSVFAMEEGGAMVKYRLREGTAPWRTDYLSFVREHDRWVRPYIWMMFEPIEVAIARQDYPQALFLAQRLYLTDPMDPRSSGYLCVSEFFMGLYDKSSDSCRKTVVSAMMYPVGFTAEELFWFRFYYGDSLRFAQKHQKAVDEYDGLLKSPSLLAKQQCPLYLSRADALVRMKKYDGALYDLLKADEVCLDADKKADVAKRTRFLNGAAMEDAAAFARKARFKGDLPPLEELRKKEYESLTAKLGPRNMRYMPKDAWITAHLAGPEYRVILKQEALNPRTGRKDFKELYTFLVNLWTGVIKLEKGPFQPAGK